LKRIVHYINQFYAGLGGEEMAGTPPEKREGHVGPGLAFANALGGVAEITGTVVCGDNYFAENEAKASETVLEMIRSFAPDLVIVGPGFNAGRYGMACGIVAKLVDENLSLPVVGGLYPENPGAEIYRRYGWFYPAAASASGMRQAVPAMAELVKTVLSGGEPGPDSYIPKGLRINYFASERGSKRAVDMLIAKIGGEPFETEYPMPTFDRVEANPAVTDMSRARVALVSSGGPVPKGNPDRIESSSASKFGKYSLAGINFFTPENGETAHGGYDPVYANEDLDRVLPIDAVRELLEKKEIGSLHDYWYATVGNGTSVANAKKYAAEIATQLIDDHVDAVILTST